MAPDDNGYEPDDLDESDGEDLDDIDFWDQVDESYARFKEDPDNWPTPASEHVASSGK